MHASPEGPIHGSHDRPIHGVLERPMNGRLGWVMVCHIVVEAQGGIPFEYRGEITRISIIQDQL